MKRNYTVVFVSMEMLISEFSEPARGANFRGGLGILAGDIMEGLRKCGIRAFGIIPLYNRHWATGQTIGYDSREINRGGSRVFGLESPSVFDVIYTDDRWQRLKQEAMFGKAAVQLLKKMNIKPDIVWFNESHTIPLLPHLKEDSYFKGTKFLFTIHTPDPAGMEKFPADWFDELGISREKYYPVFIKDGLIDFTRAAMELSDRVNAVSLEHTGVTKEMFPEWAHKIIGIRNGTSRETWLSSGIKAIEQDINSSKLCEVHQEDKRDFLNLVKEKTGIGLDENRLTLGFVRRFALYKNQYPMLESIIKDICTERKDGGAGIQVVCAGPVVGIDTRCYPWIQEFSNWLNNNYQGKFVFIPEYNFELLQKGAAGCDIWLSCPWPKWEACGTSDQRAAINGNINLTTRTGGAKEYIREGVNGFFIEPYEPKTVYEKLKIMSDLYYGWTEKGDDSWLKLKWNAYQAGKKLDITNMIKEYEDRIFKFLLNSS